MAPDSGDDDVCALRERVREVEQTVADLKTERQRPTVGRRGVLGALAGVAGAGALGAYSQRGAAQAAGQVGTQSEPVDVEAWSLTVQDSATVGGDLDVDSVSTDKESIGTYTSYDSPSVSTIQDSINNATDNIYIDINGTVTGTTSLTIDNINDIEIVIDAYGAEIDVSDSPVVDIKSNYDSNTGNSRSRVALLGGTLNGDGSATSQGIRVTDNFAYYLAPELMKNVTDRAVYVRNVDKFSEQGTIKFRGISKSPVNELVHFAGANSTGGSGTDSFRGTTLNISGGYNDFGLYMADATLYSSSLNMEFNSAESSSVGWRVHGGLKNTRWRCNVEGSGDGVVIDSLGQSGIGLFREDVDGAKITDNTGGATAFMYWESSDSGLGLYDSGTIVWKANDYRIKSYIPEEKYSKLIMQDDKAIDMYDENGDKITLFVDSGELKVTDASGTTTTLS